MGTRNKYLKEEGVEAKKVMMKPEMWSGNLTVAERRRSATTRVTKMKKLRSTLLDARDAPRMLRIPLGSAVSRVLRWASHLSVPGPRRRPQVRKHPSSPEPPRANRPRPCPRSESLSLSFLRKWLSLSFLSRRDRILSRVTLKLFAWNLAVLLLLRLPCRTPSLLTPV